MPFICVRNPALAMSDLGYTSRDYIQSSRDHGVLIPFETYSWIANCDYTMEALNHVPNAQITCVTLHI